MGAKRSAEMTEALRLVFQEGKTPAEAARLANVSKGAISQTREWQRHKQALKAADEDAAKHS